MSSGIALIKPTSKPILRLTASVSLPISVLLFLTALEQALSANGNSANSLQKATEGYTTFEHIVDRYVGLRDVGAPQFPE